ncbi:oxygen-independent coproporphyrinogen-3 oxidase [Gillisia sp. Hel1_33_143]|uniref:radical SAM family heme chaperone HemW n=1 Tax=Gillisia sp. Hel1_33_143 TaxID=1336796 RepID=UPI00087B7F39|nr:radical SAM family heme chaperone HemW [Gillisia sp. Hel1_33_143]SDR73138.1 oxygen-independent coproporphyrinogen-3 oxidase [Gillisia sp. Hel1_33_143]
MLDIKSFNETLITNPAGDKVKEFGIYIHIPFCKQACHYCDFHFSTSVKKKEELIQMICKEILLRKDEITQELVQTIYFGGGTPSLLSELELKQLLTTIEDNFEVSSTVEITLEANPDDLTADKVKELKLAGVNRLSIGVQSFFEEDLQLMNRAHNANEALTSIKLAKQYFDNISIDLIYGMPEMSVERWEENIDIALSLDLPHFSCYALTVEPNTALKKFIDKGKIEPVDDEVASIHFDLLTNKLKSAGFVQYEFSNYGKPGYFSQNNTAYWMGKTYMGVGPSAHSFNGNQRKWNINNNSLYINAIENDKIPAQKEELSLTDRYNEYVMTRLRTMWGISLEEVKKDFGTNYKKYLLEQSVNLIKEGLLILENESLKVSDKGKFLSDGISSELFYLDEN